MEGIGAISVTSVSLQSKSCRPTAILIMPTRSIEPPKPWQKTGML
jgi:hypothetical protein